MDEAKFTEVEKKVNTLWSIHTWGIGILAVGIVAYLIWKK